MKKFFVVITAIMGYAAVDAQDPSVTTHLTFEEAIKIGLEKNVTLNTQKNQLFAAQARKTQSVAQYLPNLNAQAVAQRTDGLQIDPTTGRGASLTSDQFFAQVQAGYVLFNGFGRVGVLKQNNDLFLAQDAFVKRSRQDLVFTVASQYLQVLLDQELLRIAEENLNAQKVLLEQVRGFVQVGSRPAVDEYNQDALVQSFQVLSQRARITLENDRAALAQTLQLDPSIPFTLVQPDRDTDIEYFRSLSLDSLYQIAIQHREDLKQQNYLVDAAQHAVTASTSGYFPVLSAFASYSSTYFASNFWEIVGDPDLKPKPFENQFRRENPSLSYGLNLNIPIFDRLQTRTNRVFAKVSYQNAILTRDNTLKSIKIDVQRSFKNYLTAIESYESSLVQYDAGELALRTQRESYALGIASQVELAQANQTFVQAAASRAQAEVTLVFQKVLLEYALGTLQVETLFDE